MLVAKWLGKGENTKIAPKCTDPACKIEQIRHSIRIEERNVSPTQARNQTQENPGGEFDNKQK